MLNFHTYEIQRLMQPDDESGESFKREFGDTDQTVTGFLEIGSAEFAAIVDGEFGKVFRLFSDDLDATVQIGDRLIEGEKTYDVKGVIYNTDGPGRKLEITLIEDITQ